MTALKALVARLRAFFKTRELDSRLRTGAGIAPDHADRGQRPSRHDARTGATCGVDPVGRPASIKEQHREVRGLPAVEAVLQDLRFAFR